MIEIQNRVKAFCKEYDIDNPIEDRILDAVSELGEVAKEVLKMTDYGNSPLQFRSEIKGELGDLFYSLITIANFFDINLEEAIDIALQKYRRRLLKGSPGSEND